MSSLLKRLAAISALVLFLGWLFLLRPVSLDGVASYIIVNGESMEPTYESGDLVIIHKQDGYSVGDVVAYSTSDYFQSGRIVIHRIVGGDEQGFITQGDNRNRIDEWRPTADQIRGSEWLRIPGLGSNLATLGSAGNLRVFLVAVLLLFVASGAETARALKRPRRPRHGDAIFVVTLADGKLL